MRLVTMSVLCLCAAPAMANAPESDEVLQAAGASIEPEPGLELWLTGDTGLARDDDGVLVRRIGGEIGVRVGGGPVTASAALWHRRLTPEQAWRGDVGHGEPADPAHERALQLDVSWSPARWLEVGATVESSPGGAHKLQLTVSRRL